MVASKLLIDTGAGFTDDQRIDATNNVFGDDRMTVTFDLSAYTNIERVRFHPLDGWVSRISVLSAMSDVGDAALVPEGASSADGVDTFLTTNPWYMSSSPVAGTLEISFHLALVPKAETEWNVLQLDRLARIRTAERDAAAMEFTQTYEHLMGTAASSTIRDRNCGRPGHDCSASSRAAHGGRRVPCEPSRAACALFEIAVGDLAQRGVTSPSRGCCRSLSDNSTSASGIGHGMSAVSSARFTKEYSPSFSGLQWSFTR